MPPTRVFNHFHNPLRPWNSAGLGMGLEGGQSSVLWGQRSFQTIDFLGGTWSWPVARNRFLQALVAENPVEREGRLAETFRALGQLAHLVQDASVPAHVRGDKHPSIPLPGDRKIPINSDWYEDWVEDTRKNEAARFQALLQAPPKRPMRLVLRSANPQIAPSPIAGLIDTDTFLDGGVAPRIFGPLDVGIAEFTNPNFLSRSTIFKDFGLPRVTNLGPPFLEEEGSRFRLYFPKIDPLTHGVEISHFVAEAALYKSLSEAISNLPGVAWTLTSRVHEDYARELLPRAVGYSAELFDYFFRGRLDVELEVDPTDPSLLRVVGTNASPEGLFDGTLSLYADQPSGQRLAATPLDSTALNGIASGQEIRSARFQAPADAERFVAVYQGALGQERRPDDGSWPGAVIGKVLGGVRVEEIFADGPVWKVRTPTGVLPLPLSTAQWDEVRWGDGDSTIVARTAFGPDEPGHVVAYEVVRVPGSVEFHAPGPPPTLELVPRAAAVLPLATPPLVATLHFQQRVHYRQQIGRFQHTTVSNWQPTPPFGPSDGFYAGGGTQITPPEFETLHQAVLPFAASIPITLDADHSLDFGNADDSYVWQFVDVGADRDGRLVGLAVVYLTEPPLHPLETPLFLLDSAGTPVVLRQVAFEPFFPLEVAPLLWALIDLSSGAVLASTAEATITISSDVAREGPPWDHAGAGFTSTLYANYIRQVNGGPQAGRYDDGWQAVVLVPSPAGVPSGSAEVVGIHGDISLAVQGWMRAELRDELRRHGLLDFDVEPMMPKIGLYTSGCEQCPGLRAVTNGGAVITAPVQLFAGRRARGGPAGKRVVFVGDAYRGAPFPAGHVVVWDPATPAATRRLEVPSGLNFLGAVSGDTAIVYHRPQTGQRGSYVAPLDAPAEPVFFPAVDLTFMFTTLQGGYLYNTGDMRFYRREPPLTPTALPARLSPVSGNPSGDYHAIRLP